MALTEAKYQSKIIKALEAKNWFCIKLISTNKNGIPDILALKRDRKPLFIEVKGEKGRIAPLQEYRAKEVASLGFLHHFAVSGDDFIDIISERY